MPGMGGRETMERLKQINPNVRAILSTGYSDDDRARDLMALGVKVFLQKPYRTEELSIAVRKVLDENDPPEGAATEEKTGVVLLQLGGPDSLESVEPFLYNLFCDPDIIDLPLAFLFRKRLARMISGRRAPHVQEFYKKIGRRSPILKLTLRQARALECELQKSIGAKVFVWMRYWHPLTEAVAEEVRTEQV